MPQLVKGGKWVFAWTVVGGDLDLLIPPEAFQEYGFQTKDPVVFLRGSRSSGGVIIGRRAKVLDSVVKGRVVAEGEIGERGLVRLPALLGVQAGEKLLAVRGSGLALSFLRFGRIYAEALRHPELEVMKP